MVLKLSSTQLEVIEKLRSGYTLHRDMTFDGGYTLVNEKTEDWGRKKININTIMKLHHAKLLRLAKSEFPTEIWVLDDSSINTKSAEKACAVNSA